MNAVRFLVDTHVLSQRHAADKAPDVIQDNINLIIGGDAAIKHTEEIKK